MNREEDNMISDELEQIILDKLNDYVANVSTKFVNGINIERFTEVELNHIEGDLYQGKCNTDLIELKKGAIDEFGSESGYGEFVLKYVNGKIIELEIKEIIEK